ncbi:hypothetical protein [Sphingomicrobium nitratireducens]|uniref:hypothetical protein n=1 Tax=Sphingomicrobium nitratireducens TaxID=2964666 RepID=UPI0022401321|nr:hypothetical protein [Sphingomicrobium nitratireducens]
MTNKLFMLGLGAVAFAATPALAGPPPHAQGKGKAKHHQQVAPLGAQGYGAGHCPKGLAKKNPQCMPPGQYKKQYEVGYRFPSGYSQWTPYDRIPYDLRRQYGLDPYQRYIYDQNYIYRVDPTTMIVSEVLRAIL